MKDALDTIKSRSQRQFIYGTVRGSVGTLIDLPSNAFQILNMLQVALDKLNTHDFIPRETSRKVVVERTEKSSTNIIDGDSVQKFGDLDLKRQTQVVSHMFTKDYVSANPHVINEVKQLLALIKDKC